MLILQFFKVVPEGQPFAGTIENIPNPEGNVWNPFPKGRKEANSIIRAMSQYAGGGARIKFELKEKRGDSYSFLAGGILTDAFTETAVPTNMDEFRYPDTDEFRALKKGARKEMRASYGRRNQNVPFDYKDKDGGSATN